MLKKLPIGIQTFEKIIDSDYLYIEKASLALSLIESYQYAYFFILLYRFRNIKII
jgi:hypothetical protein